MITGKPNVDPARLGQKVEASAEMFAELDAILKETTKIPTEKYSEPITSSQEIGWWSVPLMPDRKRQGTKACEITKFADDYAQAMGRNPSNGSLPLCHHEALTIPFRHPWRERMSAVSQKGRIHMPS